MKDGAAAAARARRCEALRAVPSPSSPIELEAALGEVLDEHGVKPGKLYQPIRVAITGTTVSPGIFESLAALGKERCLERIERALDEPSLNRSSTYELNNQ